MNLAQANLEDIVAKYFEGTAAQDAAAFLERAIATGADDELTVLLRDFRERAITSTYELQLRTAIDRLFSFYSILEIASIAKFIPKIPTPLASQAKTIVSHRLVKRYYIHYYPTKLVSLLCQRVSGGHLSVSDSEHLVANRAMMSFIEMDRQFTARLEDKIFLRMLDSFTIDNYRFKDLVSLIESPAEFVEALLPDTGTDHILAQATKELGLFFQFCFDLQQLLARTSESPLLQSAIWTHYGYWFEILGESLNARLGDALNRFLNWPIPPGSELDEAGREIQSYVQDATLVLRKLTSKEFAAPINELLIAEGRL